MGKDYEFLRYPLCYLLVILGDRVKADWFMTVHQNEKHTLKLDNKMTSLYEKGGTKCYC